MRNRCIDHLSKDHRVSASMFSLCKATVMLKGRSDNQPIVLMGDSPEEFSTFPLGAMLCSRVSFIWLVTLKLNWFEGSTAEYRHPTYRAYSAKGNVGNSWASSHEHIWLLSLRPQHHSACDKENIVPETRWILTQDRLCTYSSYSETRTEGEISTLKRVCRPREYTPVFQVMVSLSKWDVVVTTFSPFTLLEDDSGQIPALGAQRRLLANKPDLPLGGCIMSYVFVSLLACVMFVFRIESHRMRFLICLCSCEVSDQCPNVGTYVLIWSWLNCDGSSYNTCALSDKSRIQMCIIWKCDVEVRRIKSTQNNSWTACWLLF